MLKLPFHEDMLFTEPVVFFFSLWAAFSWAVLYLQFSSIPLVFKTNHKFNIEQSGAVFTCMKPIINGCNPDPDQQLTHTLTPALCVGVIIIAFVSIHQEKVVGRFVSLPQSTERRVCFACFQSTLLPIGLFWFGWTSYQSVPWIVPTLAIGCAIMGIFSIYLAVFNYLADTYHRYASSAIAAQSCCKREIYIYHRANSTFRRCVSEF